MLSKLRAAGLLWPTLFALPALALLIGLGNWQMSRKAWKDGLIAQIRSSAKGTPVMLRAGCLDSTGCNVSEYTRVQIRGQFQHDQERHLYAPDSRLGPGVHVYTPLVASDGRLVVVNRGFVPDTLRDTSKRPIGQIAGPVDIVGLVRAPEAKGRFAPQNDAARNLWFWRDLDAMAGCKTPTGSPTTADPACSRRVAFFIDTEAEPVNPGGWPRGGTTNLALPNRHLEYALTWYGLAATLAGVFLAYALGRLRQNG